uniref:Ribosomal protein mS38 C-terminal domain-containing protein n=1 Tax=Clastoptera arizonana TaxID=38151 RepID=A0A1B6C5R5_9HEMI
MSLKFSQVVSKCNTLKSVLLSDLPNVLKYAPPILKEHIELATNFKKHSQSTKITRPNFYVNSSFYRNSTPLNIDPPKIQIIDLPITKKVIIDHPIKNINLKYEDLPTLKQIEEPAPFPVDEKKAARLIVIRRKKMKKHQLKKLRIRMKFDWAKLRQKRELKKEKLFQAELLGKVKQAEEFDARTYCTEKINKVNAVILQKSWKGKRFPPAIIKDLVEKREKKRALKEEGILRRKSMNLNVSDYPPKL